MSPLESPLMPEGSLLLHIGPPKTGTTSLQAAFWAARDEALAQGVRYAGWSRHSGRAAMAVAKSSPGVKDRPEIRQWDALVDQVRRAREPRVILSSEHLSYAKPPAISRVVGDLEPRLIHVVVTLRPLVRILPSRWQEYAKDGLGLTYEDWLDAVLSEPPKGITPTFWLQQRHDALVARWAEVVGAGRVTVVVADDADHDGLLRIFERFTGLRAGTLVPVHDLSNRSLTRAEVEAVQALNRLLRAEGFSGQRIDEVVREIAARTLLGRRPDPAEPRIETPKWAQDRAVAISSEMVSSIASSGAVVIGDLAGLASVPANGQQPGRAQGGEPTAEIAALLALGMYKAGRRDADRLSARRRLAARSVARLPGPVAARLRALVRK